MTRFDDTETVLVLDNGNQLVSHGDDDFPAGTDVHLLDSEGNELLYWSSDEWQHDPILVMGAIFRAAAGFVPERE